MSAAWETILLISKWVFLGLIYLVLASIVIVVRREMKQRLETSVVSSAARLGRLKVVQRGSDDRLQPGQVFVLENQARIGAHPDNDIVLADRYVSGHHACLRWDGSRWLLQDLGSTNGTLVGGRRCAASQEESISTGATLEIGDVVLQLLE